MSNNAGGMYNDSLQQYAIDPAHDNRPFSGQYYHWMGYPCQMVKTDNPGHGGAGKND